MNNRLKQLRKELNLNQEEFGKRLGLTKASISRLESGTNNITEQTFISICREFNVNEEWLRTGEGEMFNELDKESKIMSWVGEILGDKEKTFQRAFVAMLASLDEDKWELIAEMAKTLYEAEQKEKE